MTYRFIEHTADVGVEIEANTYEGVLSEGLLALTDILTEVEKVSLELEMPVDLIAPSREDLLVEWLNELVYLFDSESVLLRRSAVRVGKQGDDWRLRATVGGERYDPGLHRIKTLVKAVTYHQLAVRSSTSGWQARVVFDI